MPPYAIQDFVNEIPNVISDDGNRLGGTGGALLPGFVKRAIARYTVDRQLEVVSDVAGNGTHYLDLPVAPGTGDNLPVFDPAFSVVKHIEYPIGQQPPQLVADSDIRVYRTPDGYKLLINFDTPHDGDSLRVTWTAKHLADGSTVPEADFFAVVDYAGSLAADYLASFYTSVGDSSIQADVVNYRSKSQELLSISKALRKRYFNHVGVDEGASGASEVAPAAALGNQFLNQGSGVDRLVHGKYSR